MVNSSNLIPEALQVSAFVAEGALSPQRILRLAVREWSEEYDGDSLSLPGADDFPPDVPSVFVSSKDGRRRLEAARSRVNLHRVRVDEKPWDIHDAGETLANRIIDIFRSEQIEIGRLAAVLTSLADSEDAANLAARHFLKGKWIEGPVGLADDFQLHIHRIFDLSEGLPVNSWVRVRTAKRLPGLTPVIAMEQDINSLEEERGQRQFPPEATIAFTNDVAAEFLSDLEQYFPATASGTE